MNKTVIIIWVAFFFNHQMLAQAESDVNFLASKGTWKLPVPHGYLINRAGGNGCSGITISSDSAFDVKSVFNGEVVLVNACDDIFLVVIKFSHYFVAYSNLEKALVKKGDKIRKGTVIGKLSKNLDGIYSMDLHLSKNNENLDPSTWFEEKVK